MLKKVLLVIIVILNAVAIKAQIIEKHGLVFNAGIGSIRSKIKTLPEINESNIEYKTGLSVGYRLRLNPDLNPFFIDVDANIGAKMWKSNYIKSALEPPIYSASSEYYYFSVTGTFNYRIYKGLSGGIGIEPLYFFYQDGETGNNKFDIPAVARIAYDFGKLEVGMNYKHGLTNVIKTDYIQSGKTREIQLSLFIPF